MCVHISSTVYMREVGTLVRKAVLLLLADKASSDGRSIFASKQTIADELCCSRRAVIATINAFIGEGLLIPYGERPCANGHTVEYRLNLEALAALPLVPCHARRLEREMRDKACTERTSAPGALVNEAHPTSAPDAPHQCTGFTQTILEPSMNQSSKAKAFSDKRARPANPFPMPVGVDPQHWADFLANRKRKRLANTATAHRRLLQDIARLSDSEWPPGRLIEHAAAKGWAAIFDPRQDNLYDRSTRLQQQREPCNPLVRAGLAFEAEYLARQENDLR